MTLNYPGDSDPREHGDAPTVAAPDQDVPDWLVERLDNMEQMLTRLCNFAAACEQALAKLETHPMLGKMFRDNGNGQGGG